MCADPNAPRLLKHLESTLFKDGWRIELESESSGMTFSDSINA
jgi:hypothetical protein